MDTAPAGSGTGFWLRNFGQLPAATKHKTYLYNFTQGAPGPQTLVEVWLGVCRVSAREVPWVGLAGTRLASITNFVESRPLPLLPFDHAGLPCETFYRGSQRLRSGGALGGPGEACIEFGGKESTLGAQALTKGASPKNVLYLLVLITQPAQ